MPAGAKTSPLHSRTPSNFDPERHQTHPKNAEQTRRGQPPTTPPRRLFPPARQRSQTPPDGRTNGRGVTGEMPAAAGVPYAPKPPSHANATPAKHKTAAGTDKRESRTNGARQRPPTKPSEPGKPNATKRTHERGKGPRQTEKRAEKTKRGTPGERPPPNERHAGTRQTGQTGRRPLLPAFAGRAGAVAGAIYFDLGFSFRG